MKKSILIIGAQGFIGSNFLRTLLSSPKKNDYDIHLIASSARTFVPLQQRYGDIVTCHILDVLNPIDCQQFFAKHTFQIIFHAVQFRYHPVERPWIASRYTYMGTDYQSVKNIADAISLSQQKLDQYIYISGIGVDQPHLQGYPWIKAKAKAEEIIKQNYPYTILRPSWAYGVGDKSMSKFIFFAKYLPVFPIIGDGKNHINPIYVKDLANIILNAMDNSEAIGQIHNVGSAKISMDELVHTLCKIIGKKPIYLYHPKWFMRFIGFFLQFLMPHIGISVRSVDFICMDSGVDMSRLIYGIMPRSIVQGLTDYLSHKTY